MQGVSELRRLTALTRLQLYGLELSDEQLGSIAACTGLVAMSLDCYPRRTVDIAGLDQLTQLTRLTRLFLRDTTDTAYSPAEYTELVSLICRNLAAICVERSM